ncbi:ABC transporter substrate-binding protein [bacterium]|nr:ABC transporter substrate-binding protein [bacterium]
MKKKIYILILILLVGVLFSSCLKRDMPVTETEEVNLKPLNIIKYDPIRVKTKTINGVDHILSSAPVGKFGGELVTSIIGEGPKTFNPFNVNDATSSTFAGLMYEGLLATNPYTGEVEPRLAKSFEVLPDKMTYIVKLRQGLKWSDGKEITADDVFYTYDTIIFGGYGDTSLRDMLMIEGKLPVVSKLDKYTVKFKTPKPHAPFLRSLSGAIAPKHVFKPVTDKGKDAFNSFYSTTTKPQDFVVSGPFMLERYTPAQRVELKRNPDYLVINSEGKNLPYLDKYTVQIVGDLNNETLKFQAGEIDILNLQGSLVPRYRMLEENSDYKLYNLGPTTTTTFLTFNINNRKNPKGKYYVDETKQAWFQDLNFRQAIDFAIDRESLVLNVLSGVGEPLFLPESPTSIFLNKKLAQGYKRDLSKSRELLEASGYTWDKDGILHDKKGNVVEFEMLTNAGNTQREATGVSIKEDLAELGIKVNFKPVDFNSLVNKLTNSLEWDSVIMGLTGSPLEPHGGNNVFCSFGTLHMFNQRTEFDKKNPKILPFERELDKIYASGALELDFNKRKAIYDKYQEIVYREKPFIYLYSPVNIVAVRKKIGNIKPTELGGTLYNIEELYIK